MRSPKSRATVRGRAETAGGNGGEFAAIDRLRERLPAPPPGEVWIGDDAAVLGARPGRLLITTDLSVVGVHADLALIGVDDLGWRALVAAVSDVAAMGGRPDGAVVAVAGPPDTDLDLLYDGITASSAVLGCPVIGGDLSNATQLIVAVAVAGHVEGDPGPVRRDGARAGHALFVTGPLGAGAAGLRLLRAGSKRDGGSHALEMAHRRPQARLAEGEAARLAGASAMIDVSDGLLADLGHIADASEVGFRLDEVPVAVGATLDEALGGGEDYELVVATADPEGLLEAFAEAGLRPPVRIGSCTSDPWQRTLGGEPAPSMGWEHRWR
ncbi:MAG TPA: thiamine-phosphate kinase [Acidimicrobiales bacterium]|nr:thiamine-phosphate kinase [Acidimicrobiales bacterium]